MSTEDDALKAHMKALLEEGFWIALPGGTATLRPNVYAMNGERCSGYELRENAGFLLQLFDSLEVAVDYVVDDVMLNF